MTIPRGKRRELRPGEDPLDYSIACAMGHHDECEGGCRCWCHEEDDEGGGVAPIKTGPGPVPLRAVG